jgi:hypothetical protein
MAAEDDEQKAQESWKIFPLHSGRMVMAGAAQTRQNTIADWEY